MAKLMSEREMALFKVAMNYFHAYQEATNSYVSIEDTAKQVANATCYWWDEDDIAECCEQIMGSK